MKATPAKPAPRKFYGHIGADFRNADGNRVLCFQIVTPRGHRPGVYSPAGIDMEAGRMRREYATDYLADRMPAVRRLARIYANR